MVTTNKDSYTSGETAVVSVRYTIDHGTVSPGDYILVTIPESIASSASFFCSSQHFSETEDLGNGQYRLTFGEYAASGLSGSMMIRATTNADETTTGTITAGDGEKEITVFATGGGESGTGVYADEAIMKDGLGNAGMSYGGYDYSTNPPTQIGLFDSSVDNTFTYRLYINRKNVAMSNVTVRDTLPDGISCHKIDPSTMTDTGEAVPGARVSLSGQRLTVHLGDIAYPVAITYRVFVPAQASMYLRNRSEVTYTQEGVTHQEHHDYIAQGNDYSASNGIKRVDKTIISDIPSDQWVTYTIEFWNDNRFASGDISLVDDLDDYVRFLYAESNEYFELTVDEHDSTILRITNVKEIPAGVHVYEVFVCDFGGVPVGYTVRNTVGGNATATTKINASLALSAVKTVDGAPPRGRRSVLLPPAGSTAPRAANRRQRQHRHRHLSTHSVWGGGPWENLHLLYIRKHSHR